MRKKILAFSFLFVLLSHASGQTIRAIEDRLLALLANIEKSSNYGLEPDEEKLEQANAAFKKYLMLYTGRPATLSYAFPRLKKQLDIATSKDGKFRIYSWDEGSGGSMHDFSSIAQFRGSDGTVRSVALPSGGFFHDIYQVEGSDGPLYLGVATFIASGSLRDETIRAFKITGTKIDSNVRVIRTNTGLQNSISFEYDLRSTDDKVLFTFDPVRRSFSFPVVIEDEEMPQGRVTNKRITYKFNGRNFVKSG
jgi:hypothetical protein